MMLSKWGPRMMHESMSTYFIDSFERLIHRCTAYLNNHDQLLVCLSRMNMNRRTDAECGKNCRKTEKCCMLSMLHRSVLAAEPAAVAPRLGIVSPPRQSQFSLRAQHAHPGHAVLLSPPHCSQNCHVYYQATLIDQLIYQFIHLLSYSSPLFQSDGGLGG